MRKRNKRLKEANIEFLCRQLDLGFKPYAYAVYHFNDGKGSRKEQKRRLDPCEVEKDMLHQRNALKRILLDSSKWRKDKNSPRCLWGMEYGTSISKPHINIVMEEFPVAYGKDCIESIEFACNFLLPQKCKSVLKQSCKVLKIEEFSSSRLFGYMCKECTDDNFTINYSISDWIL